MSVALDRVFAPKTGTEAPGVYQLQKMKDIHRRIAEGIFVGEKDKDIAGRLGVSTQMVAYTRESPIVQRYLGLLNGAASADALDVAQELRGLSPYAVKVMEVLMLDPGSGGRLRFDIGKDILDRAGHGATHKLAVQHSNYMSDDDIKEIKMRARRDGPVAEATILEEHDGTDSN